MRARSTPQLPARGLRPALLLLVGVGCAAGKHEDTSGFFDDDDTSASEDHTDPLVSLTAPGSGERVEGAVSWSAEASDDVGVASVVFSAEDEQVELDVVQPWGGSWDPSGLINGVHTVSATAKDGAGNTATDEVDVLVANVGGLDPDQIQISNPTEGATICGAVTVSTLAGDDVTEVLFSLDGDEQELDSAAPYAWAWDTTAVADGMHTIAALASDAEGRQAQDQVTVEVLNDDVSCDNAPSVVFVDPAEGAYVRGSVDLEVEASDDVGVTGVSFYVNSGLLVADTAVPYQAALDSTLFDDGTITLSAVATDTSEQTGSAGITVTVDNTAPVLVISAPEEGAKLSGTTTFTVSAGDNLGLDQVALYADGALLEAFTGGPYEVVLDTTALGHGAHTLSAFAQDLAGNEALDSVSVLVDNPPELVYTEPTDTTVGGDVTVTVEATDDDRVTALTLYEDGTLVSTASPGGAATTTFDTCSLAHGTTIAMSAEATDSGANTTTADLDLTVDQTLEVQLDSYDDALDYTATVGADVQDDQSITSVVWSVDGTSVASTARSSGSVSACFDCGCTRYASSFSTAALSEGTHTLSVTATNAAGETATASETVTVDYDHDGDGYDSEFYGGDDCDDGDSGFSPAAAETCDGEDNDCDGESDEDFDADGDSWYDEDACAGLSRAEDCDDGDASVSPSATETCDGVDDDCDGHIDNLSAWTSSTPNFGASSDTMGGSGSAGSVYHATSNATITGFSVYLNPGATAPTATWAIYVATTATGDYTLVDSNSSTLTGTTDWYSSGTFDVSVVSGYYYLLMVSSSTSITRYGDKTPSFTSGGGLTVVGYISSGSVAGSRISTDPSTAQIYYQRVNLQTPRAADADTDDDGMSTNCGDCDDTDATVYDGATELCDDQDNNCDGTVDEAPDADLDGEDACSDCDDADASSYTGGTEVCDGADNDCDGSIDDDPTDGSVYYVDADDDGYGVTTSTEVLCGDTSGYAPLSGDCDDADATRSPGLSEACNGEDDDCDGKVDEDFDADGDGYGAGTSCGSTADCDDSDPKINPGATETCNGKDDDCDGTADDSPSDGTTYYVDIDGDGYGVTSSSKVMCALVTGYAAAKGDCDDSSASVNPGATETCDEVDDDCDGSTDEGFDSDGDGYASCSECDDTDPDVNPSETEVCSNGIDDDCDGEDTHCKFSGTNDMGSTGYKEEGRGGGMEVGIAVDGRGDNNGDGYADPLVGAPGGSSSGVVYIIPGGTLESGSISRVEIYSPYGPKSADAFGTSVAYVGDQDLDGYDDILGGAIGDDTGGTSAGSAILMLGPTTTYGKAVTPDARLYGEDDSDYAGSGVADGGDIDGDGIDDVLVGAEYAESSTAYDRQGIVYGVLGPATTSMDLSGADFQLQGTDRVDLLGIAMARGADTDGDGYSDVLLGSSHYGSSNAGAAFVCQGPLAGSMRVSSCDAVISGTGTDDEAGMGVSWGDMDGDGYADLLVGVPGEDSTKSGVGAVYVFLGPVSKSETIASADASYLGVAASDAIGYSVAAGDLDEDGVDDVLIGAPYESDGGSEAGNAYIFYGPSSGSLTTAKADAVYVGEDTNDYFGCAVDIGGDFNGSGGPDLLIGAYNEDYSTAADGGAAYIVTQ